MEVCAALLVKQGSCSSGKYRNISNYIVKVLCNFLGIIIYLADRRPVCAADVARLQVLRFSVENPATGNSATRAPNNLLKLGMLSIGTINAGFSHADIKVCRDQESSLSIDTVRAHKIKCFCLIETWIFTNS